MIENLSRVSHNFGLHLWSSKREKYAAALTEKDKKKLQNKQRITTRSSYPLTIIPAGSEKVKSAISFLIQDRKRPGFWAWNVEYL